MLRDLVFKSRMCGRAGVTCQMQKSGKWQVTWQNYDDIITVISLPGPTSIELREHLLPLE
jgi:hypothetical protein